jgi:hypothetical protein
LEIEKKLYETNIIMGVYGAFEVTFGRERVDFLTVNRKGIWRAYEVKVTKEDFHSKAAKTFIGNYNYYAMPEWLYKEVKDEIPDHIGVTDGKWNLKKPKKVELGLPENELYINLVCALNREANKYYTNNDEDKLMKYRRDIDRYKKLYEKESNRAIELSNKYYSLKYKLEGKEVNIF